MNRDDEFNHGHALDPELGAVTAEELAEAAELSRALGGKTSLRVSDAALEGAALLQAYRHGELSPAAFARIEAELLEGRDIQVAETSTTWRRAWWWLLAAAVPAAAGLLLLVIRAGAPENGAVSVGTLPIPDVAVLEAQASWVASDGSRPAFEREMRDYRAQVLASLDVR